MLMLTLAGSVGTFPVFGRFAFFAAGSFGVAGYWQFAPRSAGGLNAGSTPACGAAVSCVCGAGRVVGRGVVVGDLLWKTPAHTTRRPSTGTASDGPAMVKIPRRGACCARRSSCRSNLRLAVERRCLLVGTPQSS